MAKILKVVLTLITMLILVSTAYADVLGGGGRVEVPNPPGDTTAEGAEKGNDNIVVGVGNDDDDDFFVWQKPLNFNNPFFMDVKANTIGKYIPQLYAAAGFTSDWTFALLRTTTTFNGFIIGEDTTTGRPRYAAFNMQPRNIASTTSPTTNGAGATDATGFRASSTKSTGKFYGHFYSPGSGGALGFERHSATGALETSGAVGGVNLVENLDTADFSDFPTTPDVAAILDRGAAGVFIADLRDNVAITNAQISTDLATYVAISSYAGMNNDNAAVGWVVNGDVKVAIVSPIGGTITTGPITITTAETTTIVAVIYNRGGATTSVPRNRADIIAVYSDGTTTRVAEVNSLTSAVNDYALSPNIPMSAAPRDNSVTQSTTFDGGGKGTNPSSQPTGRGGGTVALGGAGQFAGVLANQWVEIPVVLGADQDPDPGNNQILFPLPWFPKPFDAGGGGGGASPFPFDTTEIYTSGCMVFRAGGQTQISTLFGVTDTPTIGVNDAPFSGIALGANYTLGDVTEVTFHENLSMTATFDFDQANVTPGTQTKRGAFRLVTYGSMVPITFSLQANTTEGTHGLNFSNASNVTKHYGFFDTVFNGSINITDDPPSPIELTVYSADGILLHNSTANTTPALITNASYMLLNFTSFGTPGNGKYAHITPVVGGEYNFTDATYTNVNGTRFTVDLHTENGTNPVCGIRLISTQPAGEFIHTLGKLESDSGIAIPYPTESFLNVAQDQLDNAHGVFYEKDVDATAVFLTPEGIFTTGFDMSMGPVSATPEFSPTTLLLAVLVAGGMIIFVVRRRKQ